MTSDIGSAEQVKWLSEFVVIISDNKRRSRIVASDLSLIGSTDRVPAGGR